MAGVTACLALLVAAVPAEAVTSSLYASGLTAPGGLVWMGSHLWVSDHRFGFCRLDSTASGTYAINLATCNTAASLPGQPSYQAAAGFVYVPDASSNSQGVWRLTFDPVTETVRHAVLLAPGQGLGGPPPSAVALGPDRNLYIVSPDTSDIKRVTNPGGGATSQSVQKIGKTVSGSGSGGASGLAFVGSNLYLAEMNMISALLNAPRCQPSNPCNAYVAPITVAAPTALTSDGTNVLWFADTPVNTSSVESYTLSTGIQSVYTASGLLSSTATTPFYFATALALDPTGHLYIADDPSDGLAPGSGRAWRVTPGLLP